MDDSSQKKKGLLKRTYLAKNDHAIIFYLFLKMR